MVTAPPPPCVAARSGGRDGKAALWRRSSLTRPNPRSTSSTSYFLPNAGHCPLSSLISGMENPLLRLSASPQPLTGAAGHIQHLPSMPLQLPASTSIAFSRSSGHLHGCTPTVRSIDPTDTRSYTPHVPRAIHTHFDRSLDVYRLAGEAMNNLLKNPGASAELQHDIDDAKASMFELRERARDSTTRLPQHLS
ncbi:uncharacterized protein LOC119285781 [Triticum dicoccoides]|uniref:uncharacterized protein LOC119285781 n=1 Tax=Triticum dicoccoides TaxID=85692 RepID=UPI00188F60C7|nr:uncharacterized protein LOC119285781 [Triticum dicoccoides]